MSDKPHVYNLPGEVAMAISTNRPEFMTMRHEDNQRALALSRYARRLSDASKGIDKVEAKINEVVRKLGSGEPLNPEELE